MASQMKPWKVVYIDHFYTKTEENGVTLECSLVRYGIAQATKESAAIKRAEAYLRKKYSKTKKTFWHEWEITDVQPMRKTS